MKKSAILITLCCALTLSLFGFTAMHHENGHEMMSCLAANTATPVCPEGNPLAYIIFHIAALKSFSTAIIQHIDFTEILASLVLLAGFLVFAIGWKWPIPHLNQHKKRAEISDTFSEKIRNWLGLLRQSDPEFSS